VSLILASTACNRPDRETRVTCNNAKRWLNLDEQAVSRCLRDSSFRQELDAKKNQLFAAALTAGHNRDRAVLRPKGVDPKSFQIIERTSGLPVTVLGLGEKDGQHVGKRYMIRARLSWSDDIGDEPSVWIYGLAAGLDEKGHAGDSAMINAHALDSYQKEFLSNYCWSTSLGQPTSLCEGKVYIEIKRDPRLSFISPELIGAEFEEADSKTVLQYLQNASHQTAGTRR
jgi:hypothetical protein